MAHTSDDETTAVLRARRRAGCCSVDLVKYSLYMYNAVFLLCGMAVLGFSIWIVVYKFDFVPLLVSPTYPLSAYLLLISGSLAIVIAVLGCVALRNENRCLLLLYTYALLIIFLLEAGAGALACIYRAQVYQELNVHLKETFFEGYGIENSKTLAIDQLQNNFRCCGAETDDWSSSDWRKNDLSEDRLVPDSCCKSPSPHCGKRDHPSNIHNKGCADSLAQEIEGHLKIIGAVGLGISPVQIIGMILSCCLYVKLKKFSK